ncbi:hypothetical protein HWV62_1961 [Athelia sp. TMB]|nr:hypothetical protein HWV62_1961 [Athelia sp. TMB]
MASCLKELGRIEEAVTASQEAVNITQRQGELDVSSEEANAPGKIVAFTSEEAAHDDAVATDPVVTRNEFVELLDHASVPAPVGTHGGNVRQNIFNTVGTGNSSNWNISGDYITQTVEDTVTKISRMLPYAEDASWDPQLTCIPGTRLAMLAAIDAWARQIGADKICWIKGVAGSGKSAILHTIARRLKSEGLLASSFFFNRDTTSCNTLKTLFTTIARDLANLHADTAEDIAKALAAEPALVSASLSRQFDALILGPSRHLPADRQVVLMIDALDGSVRHDRHVELLMILRDKITQLPPQLRILITSRPTSTIEEHLSGCSHIAIHSIDIFSVENKRDIDFYVDAQLRDEIILLRLGLTSADEIVIRNLKRLAEGLFVWIVTVCNWLRTAYKPKSKLQALLSNTSQPCSLPEQKMDQLYTAILAECGDWEDADFVQDYTLVMGAIMAAKRPLSLAALRALLDGTQELDPQELLCRFGSVLIGFSELHRPILILHISFRDFITDRAAHDNRTKRFYLSKREHSSRLAVLCIKTVNRELAEPIAGTGYLAKDPRDPPLGIPRISGVSEQLTYACIHWTDHLADVEGPHMIQSHIIPFVTRHFLAWIEVVTSIDVFRGSSIIRQWLQQHAPESERHFQYRLQASAMRALGHRLGDAARLEEALLATQEAADLYQALVPEMLAG